MDFTLGLDLSKNLSFFSVPAACFCALGPHVYAIAAAGSVYDNTNPRTFTDNVSKDASLNTKAKQRITRAQQASDNGLQTLGLFAASVAAANQAGVDPRTLNALSWGYVASRVAYNVLYVDGLGSKAGVARTVVWQAGVIMTLGLWVKARLKIMDSYVF